MTFKTRILLTLTGVVVISALMYAFTPTSISIVPVRQSGYKVESNLSVEMSTDKACYAPGEKVKIKVSDTPENSYVRYRHGADIIATHPLSDNEWLWNPPTDDFRGYMVDVFVPKDNGEVVLGTIAVDVSSDWTHFPRYGFVATFDASKCNGNTIEREMEYLNRLHINGVQFQDWHWKHHHPLGGTPQAPMEVYYDIANRLTYAGAIRKYIAVQHSYGMKAMFYDLCFGALEDAAEDGVSDRWYIFKDRQHRERDCHRLPSDWKSSIYLTNPGNQQWIDYFSQKVSDVYASLDFDGFQIDQLGPRSTVYDYDGQEVDLPAAYPAFIRAMKQANPDKRLVMNAVGSFGGREILGTGLLDFAYNECWDDQASYEVLHDIIRANEQSAGKDCRTVFAIYMNYMHSANHPGAQFNTPGVLLTNAVIGALGGQHLEMGDHMLCREYFPAYDLEMSDELRTALVRYYDFMTAYENLLRDGTTSDEFLANITVDSEQIAPWPPQQGAITTYARSHGQSKVIHLLNFINADNLSWRDVDATRPEPIEKHDFKAHMKVDTTPSRIWVASPDYLGGAPVELDFKVNDGYADFEVPFLKYWTMLVID